LNIALDISVADPHHFYAASAAGKIFDAVPTHKFKKTGEVHLSSNFILNWCKYEL
jgi:hypothetical protein